MATTCGYEFQLRHFRFESADESNFYEFQWSRKKLWYVIYRTFLFLFHWGWLIAGWVKAQPDHYYTLTNWSVFFTGLYYMVSFATSLYGILVKKDYQGPKTDPSTLPELTQVTGKLPLLHKITWFLHVVSTTLALYVSLIYWITVAPGQTEFQLSQPIGQYKHSVQLILILIDFFLVAIPSRLVHFVYGQLLGFAYSIMVVIMHVTKVESSIYSFLNFEKDVGFAVGILIVATLFAAIIFHTIYFALYHLRVYIYRRTVGKETSHTTSKEVSPDVTHDNPAFSP